MNTITKADALAAGMTHEGSVCGVPCWMAGADTNEPRIALKWPALQPWVDFCDWLYDCLARSLPEKWVIEFPISAGTPIR